MSKKMNQTSRTTTEEAPFGLRKLFNKKTVPIKNKKIKINLPRLPVCV